MPRQDSRASKHDLVSFERPPVTEVALSVQFQSDAVDLEALGRFAGVVSKELPERQRHPVAPPMVEAFDKVPVTPSIEVHLDAPTTLPRTWFMSEDGVQLVQLQHDRFTLNWRELGEGVTYPRYDQLRARFQELFEHLREALDEAGTSPSINLCEVTYVNPVEYHDQGTAMDHHPDLAKIINRLRSRPRDAFLPEAEDAQLQARWRIPSDEIGRQEPDPAGRLYLSASPGLRPPRNTPIYVVNLTARLLPPGSDADSAMAALDAGHKWVVLGFKDLTTPTMHQQWGLRESS